MDRQRHLKKPSVSLLSLYVVLIVSCAVPLKQFYPDTYYLQDHIYENKPLRFILQFKGNWDLITDPNDLSANSKKTVCRWAKAGIELLFVGSSTEGLHTTRGMAENLNMPTREFAEAIVKNSKDGIQDDKGLSEFLAGRNSMIKWVYDKEGFRYAEFFFSIDTYDIRIAFCSRPDAFERFLPVYEEIMSTLEVTGGF
jgi:hypothetical protein